jgi:cytochrome P450
VFGADAECFRPERWLDATLDNEDGRSRLRAMEQVQALTFGTGGRWECLGKMIALVEMNKDFG